MTIISEAFLLFAAALTVCYFLVPGSWQWVCLLVFSLLFYCLGGPSNLIYVLVTALSAWGCGLLLQKKHDSASAFLKSGKGTLTREQRSRYKNACTSVCRRILTAFLLLNLGILCVFKYSDFVLSQLGHFFPSLPGTLGLIIPLGISFYTFQTIGYVVDVYWKKVPAERNFFRLLLFVCFFPQVTQGPISCYGDLAHQLTEEHRFCDVRFSRGCQRMLWGFFKKMAIADVIFPLLDVVRAEYPVMAGQNVLMSAFLYSLQIYADFSGYMDIVCGLTEILGIRLTENFDRPYFSKSVAEYWRRWHISLGTWFKTYLYYPIAVSGFARKLSKWGSGRFGPVFGRTLAATLALVAVWFTTGLWHGASWAYIAWGGLNGLFIIVSMWLEPVYARARTALRVGGRSWRVFVTLRTFILVTLIKIFPEIGSFSDGLGFWKHCFTGWRSVHSLQELIYPMTGPRQLLLLAGGAALMFLVSMLQRRESVRTQLGRLPAPVRYLLFALLFLATVYFGVPAQEHGGGFLYAQF